MSAEMTTSLSGVRKEILKTCLEPYEGTFASGARANNKLDLEKASRVNELAAQIVALVVANTWVYDPRPDLVVPVPNGANWLGHDIGLKLGTGSVMLDKDPDTGHVNTRPGVEKVLEDRERILIVEDVFNKGTNTQKVLDIPLLGERAIGVFCVWDRGDPAGRSDLGVPVDALIREHIPPMLLENSEYWQNRG